MMNRRAFVTGLGAVLAAPLGAEAQQTGKVWRLGVLNPSTAPSDTTRRKSPLIQKLTELGYVENQNLVVESRYAEGKIDRLPELAVELVYAKVDAIFTASSPGVEAARKATSTIPIVFTGVNDPVGLGLVASLARPGGNITGVSTLLTGDLIAKQLQFVKEILPRVSRIAAIWNPMNQGSAEAMKETQAVASSLGVKILPIAMRTPGDLDAVFATIVRERAEVLTVHATAPMWEQRMEILDFALKTRLPALSFIREFAQAGALMTYGPDLADHLRLAAVYLDKIFKGARPADLPVERPTTFELVLNLKTAKALGLTIPPSLLLRADQVLE
jgi:putative tryptophan/tyrosine transport system substrate-binding protein